MNRPSRATSKSSQSFTSKRTRGGLGRPVGPIEAAISCREPEMKYNSPPSRRHRGEKASEAETGFLSPDTGNDVRYTWTRPDWSDVNAILVPPGASLPSDSEASEARSGDTRVGSAIDTLIRSKFPR